MAKYGSEGAAQAGLARVVGHIDHSISLLTVPEVFESDVQHALETQPEIFRNRIQRHITEVREGVNLGKYVVQ